MACSIILPTIDRDCGERIVRAYLRCPDDFELLHRSIVEFEQDIFRKEESTVSTSGEYLEFGKEIASIQEAYCYWETRLEHRFLNAWPGVAIADYELYERFARLTAKEVGLLNGMQPRSVLFIGSGPLPISAYFFNLLLETKIDCLDCDDLACVESSRFLKKNKLEGAISVSLGHGELLSADKYDLIIVALLAKPKDRILRNLSSTMNQSARIICRTSEGLRRSLYEPLDIDLDTYGLKQVGIQHAQYGDTISSVLLGKKVG